MEFGVSIFEQKKPDLQKGNRAFLNWLPGMDSNQQHFDLQLGVQPEKRFTTQFISGSCVILGLSQAFDLGTDR